jgi:foldase protein PrsA
MKSVSRLAVLVLAAVLVALALVGCGAKNVATVNGQGIPLADLSQQFAAVKANYPTMFPAGASGAAQEAEFKKRLLDNMIDQALVSQEAGKMGITVKDADINKQFAEIRKQFKTDADYKAALKKFATTEAKLKDQIRQQLLLQAITAKLAKNVKVTDAQIKAYYDKNKAQYLQTAAKRVAHILVATKDAKLGADILKQIQGGADFSAMAKKYSIDTASAQQGGDLGWPTTPYVPQFQAAVDKLTKVGQLSPLTKSPYGYHIIKLEAVRAAKQKTLAEVSATIKAQLVQQQLAVAYQKFVAGLRKKYAKQITIDQAALASAGATSTK